MSRKIAIIIALVALSACAEAPQTRMELESMPAGTTRETARHDAYECAKDAVLMANSRTYRQYSWGPLVTEKTPDKAVAIACMASKGYIFHSVPANQPLRSPWQKGE